MNGSMGTLLGWSRGQTNGLPHCLYIDFDMVNMRHVGQKTRQKLSKYLTTQLKTKLSIVPVLPSSATFTATIQRFIIRRRQFCIIVSWAMTIHGVQGMTMDKEVLDLGTARLPACMAYVGLSRLTTIQGLFLLHYHPSSIRADERALLEYDRLRQFTNPPPGEKNMSKTTTNALKSLTAPIRRAAKKLKEVAQRLLRMEKLKPHLGMESLGSEFVKETKWAIDIFILRSTCSFEHFCFQRLPQLEAEVGEKEEKLAEMLEVIRDLAPIAVEDKPGSVKVDCNIQKYLYQCLLGAYKPLTTTANGNSLFHALALCVFGRTVGSNGHSTLRALAVAVAIKEKERVQEVMDADHGGRRSDGDSEKAFLNFVWDLHRSSTPPNRFALFVSPVRILASMSP